MLFSEARVSRVAQVSLAVSLFFVAGMARAEAAGKVNYVSGEVTAVAEDNTRRTLARGDTVNSGEKLETGVRGRMQIRFTDGSFLSLQPNSRFGLNTYVYNREKPEESRLVFNFLQGSMRTISGAIGKVNRANYQIKTPMATIGIRGTDYAVTINGEDLFLNVLKGLVKLGNDLGTADIKAGQTYLVSTGKPPRLFNGEYPVSIDPVEPDVDPVSSTDAGHGGSPVPGTAGVLAADAAVLADTGLPERPRLENYDSYNQFLQAMYAYKKAEADRKRTVQDDAGKGIDADKLKGLAISNPDLATETIDSPSTPALVTDGPLSVEAAIAQARAMQLPHYNPNDDYHRTTFKDFPLKPVDTPSMEQASVQDSFNLGLLANSMLLESLQGKEDNGDTKSAAKLDPDSKKLSLILSDGNYKLYFFGNEMRLNGVKGVTITIEQRP